MATTDDVRLEIGARQWTGWTSFSLAHDLTQLAAGFSLALTERAPGLDPGEIIVRPGDRITLRLGGDAVLDGHVDSLSADLDDARHDLAVQGRCRAGDLVDCSAVHKPDLWRDISLADLAGRLARPFGLAVRDEARPAGRFPVVKLDPGETAWAALERHCRLKGVLATSDRTGGLVLTRAGAAGTTTALVEGENVTAVSAAFSMAERYSEITVKGQGLGGDEAFGDLVAGVQARARDRSVPRYRPLVLLAEGASDGARATARAAFEVTRRAAEALQVRVTVAGWRQGDGRLWPLNARVPCRLPRAGIAGEMLIAGLTYRLSEGGGRETELRLTRPDAWTILPDLPAGNGLAVLLERERAARAGAAPEIGR
ncbi:phage baseplate assembly protein [Oceanibacterium hippocampi]|uniref:Phage late control gene D protein (GPD) n=1 Tax=Oceanibacterium hippocampi TaxID=745714 RepID=A0A1Y5TZP1_9PROT|nr:hypothetical protein [Oceanibacterium hippocampi]SLN77615.1 Phage late control gene D protein (GPD) [Oceanibacterium hippocampi]